MYLRGTSLASAGVCGRSAGLDISSLQSEAYSASVKSQLGDSSRSNACKLMPVFLLVTQL
jgi:hypothetical protein